MSAAPTRTATGTPERPACRSVAADMFASPAGDATRAVAWVTSSGSSAVGASEPFTSATDPLNQGSLSNSYTRELLPK